VKAPYFASTIQVFFRAAGIAISLPPAAFDIISLKDSIYLKGIVEAAYFLQICFEA